MFTNIARRNIARSSVVKTPVRNGANLAELKARINSISGIEKLTKAMKMVAASKLRVAQKQLDVARVYGSTVEGVIDVPENITENPNNKSGDLHIVFTTDRGLCGGCNNQVVRVVRPAIKETISPDMKIVFMGDKGRAALDREFNKYFHTALTDIGKVRKLTFKQCATTTDVINQIDYAKGHIWFNNFINSTVSKTISTNFYPMDLVVNNTEFSSKYENEGDEEVLDNLGEYVTSVNMFVASAEAFASEIAARMSAMSTSSKNALEMLDDLTLFYNRQRQARITSELIEIISGAAAAEEMV